MKWTPRSGRAKLAGCVWLGRYFDKARRRETLGAKRGDLLGEYMLGKNDYLDAQLLRFLAMTDSQVCDLIRDEPADDDAAPRVLDAGGKTSAECESFNRAFQRRNAPFLAMIEADEDRLKGGLYASLLKVFYNGILVPPATLAYRLAGRRQSE